MDVQVDRPATLGRSAVGPARVTRNLGVGERERFEGDRDVLALPPPADAALQRVEREALGEYARQVDRHSAARKLQRTALIRCLEAAGEPAESRKTLLRQYAHVGKIALRRKALRCGRLTLPLQRALGQRAAGVVARELDAPALRQRQILGDLHQGRELEIAEFDLPRRRLRGRRRVEHEPEIGRVETGSAATRKGKLLGEKFQLSCVVAPAEATVEPDERELLELGREPRLDVRQHQIGDGFSRLAVCILKPHAHRALAAFDIGRQRQPCPPRRHIYVIQSRVQPPRRSAPFRE